MFVTVLTATTVGYGDDSAQSDNDKIFISVLVLIGVTLLVNIGSSITVWLTHKRRKERTQKMLEQGITAFDDFKAFDVFHNDGVITQVEFVEMELVKMQLIPKTVLDELNQKFVRYAGSNGLISLQQLERRQSLELLRAKKLIDEEFGKLKISDLQQCDLNEDGIVTRSEFISCMLVKMKLVNQAVMDSLNTKFNEYGGPEEDDGVALDVLEARLNSFAVRD